MMILDSKMIKYEIIDITEPGREDDKDFMQNNSKSNGGTVSDPSPRSPLPPQIFNDEEYCGDYEQFDLNNEIDTLEQFLKLEVPPEELPTDTKNVAVNGEVVANESKESTNDMEGTTDKSIEANENPTDSDNADAVAKEASVEKENSPEKESRQKSEEGGQTTDNIEKTDTENEPKQKSKESSPAEAEVVNENGAVSSRERSEEKQEVVNEQQKENPTEAFIQSEQMAASD
ncbi:SH3 domain-binding glutamic acid-rich protein homolog isoform X2 [Maniola jurtina]|nr:SH3 domain-binding glutamic acid-rich protein homolog isoform X2 [Maniola jurtina]